MELESRHEEPNRSNNIINYWVDRGVLLFQEAGSAATKNKVKTSSPEATISKEQPKTTTGEDNYSNQLARPSALSMSTKSMFSSWGVYLTASRMRGGAPMRSGNSRLNGEGEPSFGFHPQPGRQLLQHMAMQRLHESIG